MEYKRIDSSDIEFFAGVVGSQRVITDFDKLEDYCHDELGGTHSQPEAVIKVKSVQEVSSLLSYANSKLIPVTTRGSGTGLVGAAVAVKGGVVLDISPMNRILELDEDNLTVTCEPGVLLMELAAFADENGYMYPPDPGEKTATIGGNISTNAGGMRAVKYGVTRDYVRGLTVVLADGRILELGGKVVKNSSGYDLKDIVIGSEGTLCVITKVILKLIPKPKKIVSLLIPFPTLSAAIRAVPQIVRFGASPTAIEFMEREVISDAETYLGRKFPDTAADAYLLIKFDGADAEEVERSYEGIAELCLEVGAADVLISDTEEREDSIWKSRGAFLEAIKNSTSDMDEVDVVVPRGSVGELVEFINELQQNAGIRIKCFGHAGDGNLHAYILKDELSQDEWEVRMRSAMDEIYSKAKQLNGQVSGEHGIGYAKKDYLARSLDTAAIELMRGIKKVFDPNYIMNPNKIF